jgi:hypothetical protein
MVADYAITRKRTERRQKIQFQISTNMPMKPDLTPIRATDSGRGRLWNVCDPLMCVFSLAAWVLVSVHVRGHRPRW